ncbi:hypothetical protein MnTg02_01801 [bacterium MnTg02]|nr:hypothetical protein MnTg02_01801 [bacterium MnTg02]
MVREGLARPLDVRSGADFRYQDGVGSGCGDGCGIPRPPAGIKAIDSNDDFAWSVAAGLDGSANLLSCRLLGVRCDGVLKIQYQTVGGQAFCLFEGPCVGARHIEYAAAWPVSGHLDPFLASGRTDFSSNRRWQKIS